MIETQTTWIDSGFDCDHCGGRVLRRVDSETGRRDRQCYQCESCSCQWTLEHRYLRAGTLQSCRVAQLKRFIVGETDLDRYSRWILLGIMVLAGLFIIRFAGPFVVRFLLPILIVAVAVYFLIHYVKQMDR